MNKEGKSVDLETSITEPSIEKAAQTFKRACKRLLTPGTWQELAGWAGASFELVGPDQSHPGRLAQVNDFLKIDVPGPGPRAGDGYDWVRIEEIKADAGMPADESLQLTLRSSPNPAKPEEGTAHFFGEDAISTFLIKRNNNTIVVSYHGRNETPNNKDVSLKDKIRNTIVAAGALAGFSELQWKALIKGLLKDTP